jgi:CubicO group peptidase (beta-lactamase class C family)
MADWKIPGMAVAIEQNDSILFCKGFGVKELHGAGDTGFVDEHTLFQIGSVSKSFTAALVAQLVDEGKISWEDTVKNILPDFEMYDPWVTANMQVKDIMTHRFGLKEQIGTYIPNLGYDRDDIYEMLRLIPPAYSFRGDFQYSNIAFEIAARIIERETGESWEKNVHERIFDRLGMHDSKVGGREFAATEDLATPHDWGFRGDSIYVVPEYGPEQALWWLTQIEPAGGVCCSVTDLLKWAEFHLHGGKAPAVACPDSLCPTDSVSVISGKQMKYLHKGQTIASQGDDRILLYAQGWYVEQTSEGRVYYHTGTTWGFTTLCFFMPQLDLAGAVLVDSETSSKPRFSIMRRTIDLFSDRPDEDYSGKWLAEWYSDNRIADTTASVTNAAAAGRSDSTLVIPAAELDTITGNYANTPLFGNASVTVENGTPYITIGKQGWKHPMKYVKQDSYTFRSDGHEFGIEFKTVPTNGKAYSFSIDWGYGEPFPDWVRSK